MFGITLYPIGLGLKKLFTCCRKPKAPERPSEPKKPDKPAEPNVGATKEEWEEYRNSMKIYRESKKEWKDTVDDYKKNKNEIMNEYYEKRKTYNKKYGEQLGEKTFGDKMIDATEYMLFFRRGNSTFMDWLVDNYQN